MSSVWNSILGPEEVEKIREDDDEEREAHFVLFTRPLDSMPNMSAQPLSHWAVIVEYPREPKKVLTSTFMSLNRASENRLKPRKSSF